MKNFFLNRLFYFIVLLLSIDGVSSSNLIWLETEHFKHKGGWTIDWQFIDQMGSPFLMSIGYGKPVEDAWTNISVPVSGDYRLWVRTRDWVPGHKAGAFTVAVNGQSYDYVYGVNNSFEWGWEKGPVFHLHDNAKIELKDLTGYYGRCDAIVLSFEGWTPPNDLESLYKERVRCKAISPSVSLGGNYDVVVIGGGLSGCLAAVSAARQGAKTVLIQNRGELGGNASLENLVPPVGSTNQRLSKEEIKFNPRESGIIEEIALPFGPQRYARTGKNWPYLLKKIVDSEPNLDLYLNTHATSTKMRDKSTIDGVECIKVPSGERVYFKGKIFIDCTGNGIIGLKSGAEYMYGTEGKNDFGEDMAPDEYLNRVMPSSLKYWYEPTSDTVKYVAPSWAFKYDRCDLFNEPEKHLRFREIDHQWIIELGGNDSIWVDAEKVRDDLLKLIYGIWDHQKNHCSSLKDEAWKYDLVWVGHVLGMRESYRLRGDYVLTQNDVIEQRLLEDRIAYGGWGLDNHATTGYTENVRVNREKNHTHPGSFFSIPYRSLYSRNISNLMMGGRNISVSHLGLSATRVMYTLSVIGQASGTAAGMCINNKCLPRDIYNKHLESLQQQLMKDGAYLIEKKNTDSSDLALQCSKITASSGNESAAKIINGFSRARLSSIFPYQSEVELNAWSPDDRAKLSDISSKTSKLELNAWCPTDRYNQWIELKWDGVKEFNVVHLSFLTSPLSAKDIIIEYKDGNMWRQVADINNKHNARRLVIPFSSVKTDLLRIRFSEIPVDGGLCEVRVYNESQSMIEQINRINKTIDKGDEVIVYPWQK